MAAILFKVALLTMKTAAKPLASQFEKYVMGRATTRQHVINIAQWLHRLEVSITRGAEGKTGRAFVANMSDERAVELASKVASEGFIYGMGVALVVVELNRKNKEDAAKKVKEAAEKQANRELHERHLSTEKELREQLQRVGQQLERLEQQLDARLAFMEENLGRRRSWLPLWNGGGGDGNGNGNQS
ncbi:hypothetical protein ABPG77_007909 [Micractinium sp. CCAP 211/92]